MAKKYMCVIVACGKKNYFDVQTAVEQALKSRFPSFEADGGGMMLDGKNNRGVFFYIDYRSASKVVPFLRKKGFKILV